MVCLCVTQMSGDPVHPKEFFFFTASMLTWQSCALGLGFRDLACMRHKIITFFALVNNKDCIFIKTSLRPMSNLQFYRAILSRNFIARQNSK